MLVAAVAVVGGAGSAHACSCALGTPEEHLRRADVAFVGVVVQPPEGAGHGVAYRFLVDDVLKGSPGATVQVVTAGDQGACGQQFTTGRRFIVLAADEGDRLRTNLCSGSTPATAESLAAFRGEGPAPPTTTTVVEPAPSLRADEDGGRDVPVGWLVLGGGVLLAIGLVALLRPRRAD